MYAVVRSGGKQILVEPGLAVRLEKLEGVVGDSVELSEVLMVGGDEPGRMPVQVSAARSRGCTKSVKAGPPSVRRTATASG